MLALKNELAWAEPYARHPEKPVTVFPGDELATMPYRDAVTYDPKGMGLPLITLRGVLRVAYDHGAVIDPQTVERVKRMAFAPEAFDVYLDKPGLSRQDRQRRHMIGMAVVQDVCRPEFGPEPSPESCALLEDDPLLYWAMRYWGNSASTMPEPYRRKVERYALDCLAYSLEKSGTTDPSNYVEIVYKEGEQYGRMWAATVWSNQSEGREAAFAAFSEWMSRFVGKISQFGALFDLRRDYRDKNIAFKPSVVRQGGALAVDSVTDIHKILGPALRWRIAKYRKKYDKR